LENLMKKKTILVLGTNAGQADLIRHMVARGWHTVACAHQSGLPGEALAHEFERVGIRDVEAVTDLAVRVKADIVYSVSSDLGIKTAVAVSEKLGLPHFFNSELITLFDQKHMLRAHLNAHCLSEVPYIHLSTGQTAESWSAFPCVVKPADAQGQRGVVVVDNAIDLQKAVGQAADISPTRIAIVEAFLQGVEVSTNVLVRKGKVVINEVSERLVHRGPLFGIPKGHLIPCYNVSKEMCQSVRHLVEKVVQSLGIQEGCLYFQMKITPDGPKIIEIAPRLDGCHMWRLITHSRGFDFLKATVAALLGEEPETYLSNDNIEQHELMFQQSPPGGVVSYDGFQVPQDALYHEYRYNESETILPINGRLEVVGYYVRLVSASEATKFEDDKP
jgi:biotin carboxylase